MTGYSGTPLYKKLGLSDGIRSGLRHAPANYNRLLPDYYPAMSTGLAGEFDWLHAFYTEQARLNQEFPKLKAQLAMSGQLWISWLKKASGLATDITEDTVRAIGLGNGLVDVKVAAIDEVWSGLKFVYRRRDRQPPGQASGLLQ